MYVCVRYKKKKLCRLKINHVLGNQNMCLFLAQWSTWLRQFILKQITYRELNIYTHSVSMSITVTLNRAAI